MVIRKKNCSKKRNLFGLLISSYISGNKLIHAFNCFETNSMTAHKLSESRSTFVKKILFI